jgi:dolichyl-phosphate-mannose--protein O-mannosyl transferase
MVVVKKGKKYVLLSKKTGRVLGTHPSRANALKQEKAIQISKARAAGHKIPFKKAQ